MIKVKAVLVYISVIFCLYSCDDTRVFDEYQSLSGSWGATKEIQFTLPILDSIQPYNLYITTRNTNEYAYSNLFLITKMQFPNGKVVTDTLEYEMAAPTGEWLGVGFTDIKESKLVYKEQVRFLEQGTYTITLEHAMRKQGEVYGIQDLQGITDIGFRIEHLTNP